MSEAEILIGLAEIALGTAGFSGVIFALSPPEKRTGSSLNALATMVCNSTIVVVQTLLAVFFLHLFDAPWGWASAFSLATSLASLPVFLIVIPRALGQLKLPIGLTTAMAVVSFSQLFIHAANLPLFNLEMFPLFFIAECCLLITALMTFVYLVIQLGSPSERHEGP